LEGGRGNGLKKHFFLGCGWNAACFVAAKAVAYTGPHVNKLY